MRRCRRVNTTVASHGSHIFSRGLYEDHTCISHRGASASGAARVAVAQTATQTVTYQVTAINQISITGAAPTLIVNTAVAGSAPSTTSSSGITWAVTTNQTGAKINASIPSVMPAGLTLSANMGAPAGATSAGTEGADDDGESTSSPASRSSTRADSSLDVLARCNDCRRRRGVGNAASSRSRFTAGPEPWGAGSWRRAFTARRLPSSLESSSPLAARPFAQDAVQFQAAARIAGDQLGRRRSHARPARSTSTGTVSREGRDRARRSRSRRRSTARCRPA